MVEKPTAAVSGDLSSHGESWRTFMEATIRVQGTLEAHLKRGGDMSLPEYYVLVFLHEADGQTLRMGQLADYLGYIPSRLTYLVSGLVKRGWVDKVPAGEDRRGLNVSLTEEGKKAAELGASLHKDIVSSLFSEDLSEDQVANVGEVFEHLAAKSRRP